MDVGNGDESNMKGEKIRIQGVPETMLQTLYARAKASQAEPHYIYDEKAIEIVSRLEYDFSLAEKDYAMSSGVLARTILLDRMVSDFLAGQPGAVVVNLACGLDTRCYRVNGYSRWYNLDLPETMAVRERFLSESDPVFRIAASAMDGRWASAVEQTDEPVLIVIEGLTMYLTEADVRQIFSVIGERFSHATVFAETMSPFIVRHFKEKSIEGSQAKFIWGVRSGDALEKLLPGFRSIRDVSLVEGMQVFAPVYRVLGKVGFIRNLSNKIMVLER